MAIKNKETSGSNSEKKKASHIDQEEHSKTASFSSEHKKKTRQAQEDIDEQYQRLRESASELFEEGKKKISETQDILKEYPEHLIKNIQKNPITSVLIAGGIGFILAKLFRK